MFLHIVNATLLRGYSLRLEFSDGTVRDVDLSDELHGEVFEPLRDPALFAQVTVNPETGTVEWPTGADFAPEFLSRAGREVQRVA
ncbi:MAG TPA: DUF2442 domain-containing protein [Longimicrobium sp.]|jgi:hypothetical protein|nr:DUF2442 domain-containing protein [Longimicrobium sp.]